MVLGFDDAVGRGAFARDVAVWVLRKGKGLVSLVEGLVLCWGLVGWGGESKKGGKVGVDLQVDEFASVVFHDCCSV